jgi:hypothetical protein
LVISPLFFHTVPNLVQALYITYHEIFQALAEEADVWISVLTASSDGLGLLGLPRVWQTENVSEAGVSLLASPPKPRFRNGFGSKTSPSAARAWKFSSFVMADV